MKCQHYLVLFPIKTATLTSVLEPICFRNHVRLLANRGYSSVTAMYDAAERFSEAWDAGKKPVVINLGDHDPSGIDITRDIDDRLNLMSNGADPTVERVAHGLPPDRALQPAAEPSEGHGLAGERVHRTLRGRVVGAGRA